MNEKEPDSYPYRAGAEGTGLGSQIRTILFDFDGTLAFHEPDSFDVVRAFCVEIGQPLSREAERQGRRMRHQYFVDPETLEQISVLSRDQFWFHFNRYLLQALCVAGDLDRLAGELTERFAAIQMRYYCPETGFYTLMELRSRGYQLGLVTNREDTQRFTELLDKLGLRSHFDLTLTSGEVGVRKPEAGIFYAALERIGVAAKESVYVGDNYWADVVGARNAGVTPVLLDPYSLFPEAECLRIDRIDGLLTWLP
ncbi:MAG: HAD family hydrolase [Anaerolineae bacterium]